MLPSILDRQIAEANRRQNAVHAELFAARTEAVATAARSVSS